VTPRETTAASRVTPQDACLFSSPHIANPHPPTRDITSARSQASILTITYQTFHEKQQMIALRYLFNSKYFLND
jgi:hypothetical protein